MKTIDFKCSHCGYEWSKSYSDSSPVNAMQKCPKCFKYSNNCIKLSSPWAKMLEKSGKKVELERK